MSMRLQGGFETSQLGQQVRSIGNDMLKEAGISGWTVTLRPVTAADIETLQNPEDHEAGVDTITRYGESEIELALPVSLDDAVMNCADEAGGDAVRRFVEIHIIDVLYQLMTPDDLDDELGMEDDDNA